MPYLEALQHVGFRLALGEWDEFIDPLECAAHVVCLALQVMTIEALGE